jgi:hypothetical protein
MPDKSKEITAWTNILLTQTPLLLDKIRCNTALDTEGKIIAGLTETLRFLYLCSISSKSLTPSQLIDEVWHELILFTRTYHSFCLNKLGKFVHHQPSSSQTNVINQYKQTLRLYKTYFGSPNTHYWPTPSIDIAQCGPCEN